MSNRVNITDAEIAHQKALALIYRHTHRDYKGTIQGDKSIMVCRNGATCLVALDDLTEAEVADRLPSALKKEAERKAKNSDKRPPSSVWELIDDEGDGSAAMCM